MTVEKTYGAASGEKLLFGYFQELTRLYFKRIKGDSFQERASSFSKIRDSEGYSSSCEIDSDNNITIIEYHSPYESIINDYPMVLAMEDQMIGKLFEANVTRKDERASGLVKYTFELRYCDN